MFKCTYILCNVQIKINLFPEGFFPPFFLHFVFSGMSSCTQAGLRLPQTPCGAEDDLGWSPDPPASSSLVLGLAATPRCICHFFMVKAIKTLSFSLCMYKIHDHCLQSAYHAIQPLSLFLLSYQNQTGHCRLDRLDTLPSISFHY